MLAQSVGDVIAPESQALADFFALSEARLNDHGLTIDYRVNEHIKNLYEEGECEPAATIRKFRIVQTEGARQVERVILKAPRLRRCPAETPLAAVSRMASR